MLLSLEDYRQVEWQKTGRWRAKPVIYLRDAMGYQRHPVDNSIYDLILQPQLWQMSAYEYDAGYLQRDRTKARSWVLLQPEIGSLI